MIFKIVLFIRLLLLFVAIKIYGLIKKIYYSLFGNKNLKINNKTVIKHFVLEKNFLDNFKLSKTVRAKIYLFKWNHFFKFFNLMTTNKKLSFSKNFEIQINKIFPNFISADSSYRFLHNGHLGDIVYSLLFLKNISTRKKKKIEYFIKIDENDGHLIGHPSGNNIMISENAYLFIKPLIESQPYIKFLKYDESVDDIVDLSNIRNSLINLSAGSITDWYSKIMQYSIDLSEKWLNVNPKNDNKFKDMIIVSRSERYLNISINYSFLNKLKNVFFIGSKKEFDLFKSDFNLKNIKYLPLDNAYEAANIIYSSKIFIGNQSLFFSIAEGLKVTRALEVYEPAPNVIPIGKNCSAFLTTNHLINFVEEVLNINIPYKTNVQNIELPNFLHVR